MIKLMQPFSVTAARHYIDPLLDAHYAELCTRKEVFNLAPDYDKFQALHDQGDLQIVVALDGNEAVGYSVCIETVHIHYMNQRVSYEDALFLRADHRGNSTGARLMRYVEAVSRSRGNALLLRHAKPGTALDKILSKRQRVQEIIYAQSL